MNRIASAFEKGKAFIPFFTCGDPDLETTERLVREAVKNGADLVELGIPFSDPTAEGPVILGANIRALSGGVTTDQIFEMVKRLRRDVTAPMVFLAYANVIFSYGAERFISTCQKIGIDGLLLSDLPFEEKQEFKPLCSRYGVALLSFLVPAARQRIARIAEEAEGFLYLMPGPEPAEDGRGRVMDLVSVVKVVREHTGIPCAVGFQGEAGKQRDEQMFDIDGVIAETHLVQMVADRGRDSVEAVGEYVKRMKKEMAG